MSGSPCAAALCLPARRLVPCYYYSTNVLFWPVPVSVIRLLDGPETAASRAVSPVQRARPGEGRLEARHEVPPPGRRDGAPGAQKVGTGAARHHRRMSRCQEKRKAPAGVRSLADGAYCTTPQGTVKAPLPTGYATTPASGVWVASGERTGPQRLRSLCLCSSHRAAVTCRIERRHRQPRDRHIGHGLGDHQHAHHRHALHQQDHG